MARDESRLLLLEFLDEHAFEPVARMPVDRADRLEEFEDAQARSDRLRRRYHERCATAAEVRRAFLDDVRDTSARLDRELDRYCLPTLPGLREAFLALCKMLGVEDDEPSSSAPQVTMGRSP